MEIQVIDKNFCIIIIIVVVKKNWNRANFKQKPYRDIGN